MGGSASAPFDYEKQLLSDKTQRSVDVPGTGGSGETPTRRHLLAKDKLWVAPFEQEKSGGYRTLWDAFQRGVTKFPNNPLFGTRPFVIDEAKKAYVKGNDKMEVRGPFVWDTYGEVDKMAREFGAGLISLGATQRDNIGIFSNNRSEWMIGALGMYSQNMRVVSLYATLGDDAVEYIIDHAAVRIVLVSVENMPNLLKSLRKVKLTHIIQFDYNEKYKNIAENINPEHLAKCEEHKVELLGFSEVRKRGQANSNLFPVPPNEDDLSHIMYTSGTTGMPKGVLLTHGGMLAAVSVAPTLIEVNERDVYLSYLPLAHIFETLMQVGLIIHGGSIGFYQGSVKKLTEDISEIKPTIMAGVPRVYQRIYQKVFESVNKQNCVVKFVFNKAYNGQCELLRAGKALSPSYDNKVFKALRAKLGFERIRIAISGAAPCPPYLFEFLKVVTAVTVIQGYGMTETCAAISFTNPDDNTVGHCGPPGCATEVKLVDISEMEYLSTDKPHPRGEVWVRGANIFKGYHKDEKSTSETLKEGGWLATGDVGRWNPNGTLSIIDRKKNMFKLSQGEYIAVEKVEAAYAKAPGVGQIWVYGNSYKSFLLAVVVPSADFYSSYCQEKGWWPTPAENVKLGDDQFIKDFASVWEGPHAKELRTHLMEQLRSQEKPLKGFEKITDIIIENNIDKMLSGFSEANGCLTPTFKLRRSQLLKHYIKKLKDAYAANGEPPGADEKWPGED